jgi:RNA polymerase sigma factor for flagellar operon FliA
MNTRDKLILDHLTWAQKIATKRIGKLPRRISYDDIESAALMGLVDAANRYDESKGVPFTAYAFHRINGAIFDFLREFLSWKHSSFCHV